jgi:hypothetical protein
MRGEEFAGFTGGPAFARELLGERLRERCASVSCTQEPAASELPGLQD